MEVKLTGEAFLDVCGKCGGQFFDSGEMLTAFGLKADVTYWDAPETGGIIKDGTLPCPRCRNPMWVQDVALGGLHCEIDRCGRCHGIWLDGGEVTTILAIADKMTPIIEEGKAKARAAVATVKDDFSSPGLIAKFLRMFSKK